MYDFHTHFVPKEVVSWIHENAKAINAKWEIRHPKKEEFLIINDKWAFEFKQLFHNLDLYMKAQTDANVSHSIVSPIPQLFLYDFESEITREFSFVYNNALAQLTTLESDNFSALGTVPLNDPEGAAHELRRSMELGLKGAIIGPGVDNQMLTAEQFKVFWQEANDNKAIIFIHPLLNNDPRLKKKKMPNLIGVPWETTVTATDLILNGHLDEFPDVKILLAHGGGFLPYQIGRLTKGYEEWHEVSSSLRESPLGYLKRFWYDSVVWQPQTLTFLKELVGEDHIVPGSDFPFDLSTWPPELNSNKGSKALLRFSSHDIVK